MEQVSWQQIANISVQALKAEAVYQGKYVFLKKLEVLWSNKPSRTPQMKTAERITTK